MNPPEPNKSRLNLSYKPKASSAIRPQASSPVIEDYDDVIDLRGLAYTLWREKWIVVICTLISTVLGFLAVSQFEPVYRASAKVMFDIQKSNVVNIQEVLIDQQFDASKLEDQIEILRSTNLIERVITELNLDQDPDFNPNLREPKVSFIDSIGEVVVPLAELIDLARDIGLLAPRPPIPDPIEAARRERLNVIKNVLEGLDLKPVGESRVIEISYESGNPKTPARIANTISDQYIVDQLEAKLEATRSATSWLSTRVEELRLRVQRAEEAVENVRSELSNDTGQTLEVTQQQLEALNGSLSTARTAVSGLQSLYDRLTAAVENGRDLGAISEFRESNIIQRYRQQETEFLSQKVVLEASVREGHPALVRLQQQIDEVRRNTSEEAKRIVAAAEIDLQAAKDQEAALVIEVRRLEQKALEQSGDQLQLRQLDSDAQASRVLYENFLGRLQETSEQEDLQEADARVLSPAEQPLYPEGQAKRRTMLLATLLGTTVGVGIVFLLNRLNNTFRSRNQLEDLTGETVLGVLPSIGSRISRRAVIQHLRKKPGSSLAEAVRNLRTSILFSNIDMPPKVVMFTSSVPREGKSTSSMLVAMTSRQMGKSAIIVDCDLRLPVLARILNVDDGEPGLMSLLEGQITIEDAIFHDPETSLHVLMTRGSGGHGSINAADVLSSRKFEELIRTLSEMYDLVILDTPPALVVTDARIVSKLADTVVYTVQWDKTPRDAVVEGLKELRGVNAPIAGVVMTQVNEDRASLYSYDGYSYYQGKYRDYYGT